MTKNDLNFIKLICLTFIKKIVELLQPLKNTNKTMKFTFLKLMRKYYKTHVIKNIINLFKNNLSNMQKDFLN